MNLNHFLDWARTKGAGYYKLFMSGDIDNDELIRQYKRFNQRTNHRCPYCESINIERVDFHLNCNSCNADGSPRIIGTYCEGKLIC